MLPPAELPPTMKPFDGLAPNDSALWNVQNAGIDFKMDELRSCGTQRAGTWSCTLRR